MSALRELNLDELESSFLGLEEKVKKMEQHYHNKKRKLKGQDVCLLDWNLNAHLESEKKKLWVLANELRQRYQIS